MNSQLNPNAAEFVPVSPKRLLMDDPIIASSPARGFEKSLDNIPLPSEHEFSSEISQRPGDLEYSNGPKNGDDYLGNLSTLHKNGEGFNASSVCSELAGETLVNLSGKPQENIPFDKFAAFQNMEEKVTSAVLEKANLFGENIEFSNNAFEATNIFGKSDPMSASFMGTDLPSPEPEDNIVPGTPRSTTVEAPSSPTTEEISPAVHHTELDSPVDDFAADTQKSPDLISPGDGPHDGITSAQERTSSSGFESESGADDNEPNAVCSEGFSTEFTKSPIDMNFESNQAFSNTNPFNTQQPPISPTGQLDASEELNDGSPSESEKKDFGIDHLGDQIDFMSNAPSFVSPQVEPELEPVQFSQLETPKDTPEFLCVCPPKPSETQDGLETLSGITPDEFITTYQTNVNDVRQNLFSDDTNPDIEETSFTIEEPKVNEASHVDLDSTEGFLETESKILQDTLDCEQSSKQDKDLEISHEITEAELTIPSPVSPKAVEKVLAAFDDIKLDEQGTEVRNESHDFARDVDIEAETKEMKLEFESHIADSHPTPEELKSVEEGFEVINKEELSQDIDYEENLRKESEQATLVSPTKETNPFKMDDDLSSENLIPESRELPVELQNSLNNDFMNTVDQFSAAIEEKVTSENYNQVSSTPEDNHLEPEAIKTVSYQTLTPANEPQITKSDSYVTGEEEIQALTTEEIIPEVNKLEEQETVSVEEKETVVNRVESESLLETKTPVVVESVQKSEPVQSTTVTETLITALEETSQVPSVATTEVPSSAGTPPPTPAPGLDDSKELQDTPKTDILVAAVAAAGAVAAGSAILAEKEVKKTKEVSSKKPSSATKKPDVTGKLTTSKTTTTKAPAPKQTLKTTTTTTTKPAGTATKTATTKPAAPKTSAVSTAPKKPIAPASAKPAPAATKQTTTTLKSVPKQLPLTKTTPTALKSLTPNSKPTTPTTARSPMLKSPTTKPLAKSPTLGAKTSVKQPAAEKPAAEKKPLTNGDIKLPKKSDVPKKPTPTTARPPVTKSTVSSKTATPPLKTASSATTNAAKPKSASTLAPKPAVGAKRPSTAPTAKPTNGKEAVPKLAPRTKPVGLLNGKSSSTKPAVGVKKTDSKPNATKTDTKPPPIRKPEEMKKAEQKSEEIQESLVTVPTTNGFADHNEDQESMKIEDLAPVTVEMVN